MVYCRESFFAWDSTLKWERAFHGTEPIWHADRGANGSRNEISGAAAYARANAPRTSARAGTAARSRTAPRPHCQVPTLLLASQTRLSASPSDIRRMEQRQSSPHGSGSGLLHDFFSRSVLGEGHRYFGLPFRPEGRT